MKQAAIPEDLPNRPIPRTRTYEELIEDIVMQMVDHPDDVEVVEVECSRGLQFEICLRKEDKGRLIGKSGNNIGALHRILSTISRGVPIKLDMKEA